MKEKISIASIFVNIILSGAKISVGILTQSASVLAEGLHSFMDILASAIGFAGIRISTKRSDKNHPYGHYKFEVLAGAIITLVLLVSGLGIIYEAYQGAVRPHQIRIHTLAYWVMILSAIVNGFMAYVKINCGKKENSVALLSDGVHSKIDVFVSLAVLCGLFAARYWIYADPLLALLVGLYIIKESFPLGKEAFDSLLDASAGEEVERKIRSIAEEDKVEVASLKTQKKGSVVTANLAIKLPGDLSVEDAEKISGNLRRNLVKAINNLVYVVIEIESHEMSTGFYAPAFGRGFGWRKKGLFKKEVAASSPQGPGGYCVCAKCGYKTIHQTGAPCAALQCPHCKGNLEREL